MEPDPADLPKDVSVPYIVVFRGMRAVFAKNLIDIRRVFSPNPNRLGGCVAGSNPVRGPKQDGRLDVLEFFDVPAVTRFDPIGKSKFLREPEKIALAHDLSLPCGSPVGRQPALGGF